MNFLHYEVSAQSGDVIQVLLAGNAAYVRLMDDNNFHRYRSGQHFQFYGGYFKQSPAIVNAPSAGRWHVVVDLADQVGRVNAEVRLLRSA
jgi:hypothetical protein